VCSEAFSNVERLKRALRSVFADPSIEDISADDLLGDYPAVQYIPRRGRGLSRRRPDPARRGLPLGEDLEILRAPFEGLSVNVLLART
jgi:hypothetical protein